MGKLLDVIMKIIVWLVLIGELAHVTGLMKREAYRASRSGIISLKALNAGLVGRPKK